MSLDFHPLSPALLAVGLYNGSVLVFDVRNKSMKPIYSSSIKSKKHTGTYISFFVLIFIYLYICLSKILLK